MADLEEEIRRRKSKAWDENYPYWRIRRNSTFSTQAGDQPNIVDPDLVKLCEKKLEWVRKTEPALDEEILGKIHEIRNRRNSF